VAKKRSLKMSNEIRIRFAPSPTGYLHVGGLRTALYNYLYAKKVGGKFILRIEDTDRSRYVEGAVENLIDTLKAVGLDYDEGPEKGGNFGPYFQSERTEIYRKYADELIEKKSAYYCFCSPEDLEKIKKERSEKGLDPRYDGRCSRFSKEEVHKKLDHEEPYVIRLKIPNEGEISFYDVVREKVTFSWETVDDQVLIKSDGYPTYHLANVVDDHLMEISHVIRGEEWLSSLPKHLFMYEQFGWKPPKMAHLPLLLNPDRSKLSKRQGDVAVENFLEKGFLKETLLNFIALLGWHPKGDREFFTLKELEKEFSLKRITKAGAVFDIEKLKWMNGHYLRTLDLNYISEKVKPFFEKAGIDILDKNKFRKVVDNARMRISTLSEIIEEIRKYYFVPELNNDQKEIVQKENSQKIFQYWIKKLQEMGEISKYEINDLTKNSMLDLQIKGKDFYIPIRLALIGEEHGPDFPSIIVILGKEETVNRLIRLVMTAGNNLIYR